ncbi:polysaccharide deacetylase family protein [Desulfococcus sp.]|uniref:polysaccharide deacetylase family protein n=1 Tax=Desulfococcus sp. TaxID=2025834 RepID=UPI0035937253
MFRLDRFLTLYLAMPIIRKWNISNKKHIPILMYHSISDDSLNQNTHPYYDIVTTPKVFDLHLRILSEKGYQVVNLENLPAIIDDWPSSGKIAVITFDDGYRDFYLNAYPILKKYNFTSDVFLPTDFIGESRRRFTSRECLNWNEVKMLRDDGICFGSHSASHSKMVNLKRRQIEYELHISKAIIEDKTGKPVLTFSYPYAFPEQYADYTYTLKELLINNGYQTCVTTMIGTTCLEDDIYFLKRIPVNRHDNASMFRAKTEGGYNWVYSLQLLWKMVFANRKG